MNETLLQEAIELERRETVCPRNDSINLVNDRQPNLLIVGLVGCGAIANIITDFSVEGKLHVDLKFFYDLDLEKAEKLASKVNGIAVPNVNDMLNHVDIVIEAASPQAVKKIMPKILKMGKDVIIMSVGALLDDKLKNRLENIALENNSKIYTPSGAIVGLDGIKAASMGKITKVNLVTRKPPQSLGTPIDEETILYEGKASAAVRHFPKNMNVAATLSIACGKEAYVKVIVDPKVDQNIHEIYVAGDFGEFKTTSQNRRCTTNPKTSVLAAYSAIKLLKSLNKNLMIGT